MAALLTLLAIIGGLVVGLTNGGRIDRVLHYRPELWPAGLVGVVLQLLIQVTGMSGGAAVAVDVVSVVALLVFAIVNVRLGGMVLIVVGLALNLVPTVINWGIPTSRAALVTADVISEKDTGSVTLNGPRHVATDDDSLTWLGETIALPTGQVISFGDVLLQFGYLLVTASLVRGRVVRHDGEGDYPSRIAALGRGPAARRGPGLHPSRLPLRPRRQTTEANDNTFDADSFDDDSFDH